jgi:hypothetical protein
MISALLTLLVYLLVLGVVVWLVFYVLSMFPLPAPFDRVARVVVVVIVGIILIMLLLDLLGGGGIGVPRLR